MAGCERAGKQATSRHPSARTTPPLGSSKPATKGASQAVHAEPALKRTWPQRWQKREGTPLTMYESAFRWSGQMWLLQHRGTRGQGSCCSMNGSGSVASGMAWDGVQPGCRFKCTPPKCSVPAAPSRAEGAATTLCGRLQLPLDHR